MELKSLEKLQARHTLTAFTRNGPNDEHFTPQMQIGQRVFQVGQISYDRFIAWEFRPTGTIVEGETDEGKPIIDYDRMSEIKTAYNANPNGFRTWAQEQNLDPDSLPLTGGGYFIDQIRYQTADACVDAILSAVEANTPLQESAS